MKMLLSKKEHVALLDWFDREARDLPWRYERSSYRVWISEVMLQQTRVSTVVDYYKRFMTELPTLPHLARVDEDRLLALWSGLGYYSRARRLKQAAQSVVIHHGGELPREYASLAALPGFGPYTTAAVLSLAHNQDFAVLDGNVIRVYSRLFALDSDVSQPSTLVELQRVADTNLMKGRAGNWNEALMELGALVCTPRSPSCDTCPLRSCCLALKECRVLELPRKRKKPTNPCYLQSSLLLLDHEDRLLLERRPDTGLLAGLWALPEFRGPEVERRRLLRPEKQVAQRSVVSQEEEVLGLHADHLAMRKSKGDPLVFVRSLPPFLHHYSHYSVEIHGVLCRLAGVAESRDAQRWLKAGEIVEEGISASDRRLIELLSLL